MTAPCHLPGARRCCAKRARHPLHAEYLKLALMGPRPVCRAAAPGSPSPGSPSWYFLNHHTIAICAIAICASPRIQSFFPCTRLSRGPLTRINAIYPGSCDPPTNGHFDLIERGSKIFDELVVAILRNPDKDPLFTVADRRKMLESMTSGFDNVSVDTL